MPGFDNEQKRIYDIAHKNVEDITKIIGEAKEPVLRRVSEVYAKYLTGKSPDQYYSELIDFNRLKKLLDDVQDLYNKSYVEFSAQAIKELRQVFIDTYYRFQYLFHFFIPQDLKFIKLQTGLADYTLRGSSDLWQRLKKTMERLPIYTPKQGVTLSSLLNRSKLDNVRRLHGILNRTFLSGETYGAAKKELSNIFDRTYNIERILRTETTRLSNLGAYTNAIEAEKQGIEQIKEWLSTLDARTRNTHQSLDGQKRKIDQKFESSSGAKALFPGQFDKAKEDINCRCTHIFHVDGIRPQQRRGRNPLTGENEVFQWGYYPEWLKQNLKGA